MQGGGADVSTSVGGESSYSSKHLRCSSCSCMITPIHRPPYNLVACHIQGVTLSAAASISSNLYVDTWWSRSRACLVRWHRAELHAAVHALASGSCRVREHALLCIGPCQLRLRVSALLLPPFPCSPISLSVVSMCRSMALPRNRHEMLHQDITAGNLPGCLESYL